jgi:hypothetical protein
MVLWPVLVYVVPNQQIQVRKVPPRGMTWRTEELVARWRLHEAKLGDGTRGGGSGAAAARLAELARGGTRARERVRPRRRKRARQSPTPTAHVERQSFTGSEAELQRRNASGRKPVGRTPVDATAGRGIAGVGPAVRHALTILDGAAGRAVVERRPPVRHPLAVRVVARWRPRHFYSEAKISHKNTQFLKKKKEYPISLPKQLKKEI